MSKEKLTALFEGNELSSELKESIGAIFEAELNERVSAVEAELTEKYETAADKYKEYVLTEMQEKTDQYITEEVIPALSRYLEAFCQEYVTENKEAITNSVKVDAAEKFLAALAESSKQFNVTIPEGSEGAVSVLESKVEKLQKLLDSSLVENETLKKENLEYKKGAIFSAVSEGLSDNQKEKLKTVSESVEFVNESQYEGALKALKSSYYPEEGKGKLEEGMNPEPKQKAEPESYRLRILNSL